MNWIEFVGIMASVFVLVSFVFKNQLIIRSINVVGCIVFVVYGLLIHSLSIWILNGILIFVHGYYIVKCIRDNSKTNKSISESK